MFPTWLRILLVVVAVLGNETASSTTGLTLTVVFSCQVTDLGEIRERV